MMLIQGKIQSCRKVLSSLINTQDRDFGDATQHNRMQGYGSVYEGLSRQIINMVS